MTDRGKLLSECLPKRFMGLLVDEHFLIRKEIVSPEHFGNVELVFSSPKLGIRFLKDRGQFFIQLGMKELGSDNYVWHDLWIVFEYLNIDGSRKLFESVSEMSIVLDKFSHNYEIIKQVFTSSDSLEEFYKFVKSIKENMIEEIFGKQDK